MEPTFDAQKAYAVWRLLIAEEELYDATLAGTHASLRRRYDLDDETIAILDVFSSDPGTRWNIENLRFRAAGETRDVLLMYLPRTVKLLTAGSDDWLRDISYEYLAHHHWQALGQNRLSECQRFGNYVLERIAKRRRLPDHCEALLHFERSVVDLLRSTADLAAADWPSKRELFEVASTRPRLGRTTALIDLPVDISAWISSGELDPATIQPEPLSLLVQLPSPSERYKIQRLNQATRALVGRCSGEKTALEIAEELEPELEIEAQDFLDRIYAWMREGVLVE